MINLVEIIFQSLEMIPDLCFITKADGEILNLNQIAIEKLNCKKEKVIGKKFSEILAPHSILTFEYEFHESLKIKKNTKLEGRIQTADEKIIALKLILSRLDFSEKEKYILIYGHDITEERQREIDLLRFYYVAENTVNPLQITDLSGKMIFVNPAFVEASGYSKEELIGKSPSIFGSNRHSPKFWDSVWNIISEGKVWSGTDALQIGLIDKIGGLETAINIAKEKIGIKDDNFQILQYPKMPLINFGSIIPMPFSIMSESNSELEQLKFRFKKNGVPLLMTPLDLLSEDFLNVEAR